MGIFTNLNGCEGAQAVESFISAECLYNLKASNEEIKRCIFALYSISAADFSTSNSNFDL